VPHVHGNTAHPLELAWYDWYLIKFFSFIFILKQHNLQFISNSAPKLQEQIQLGAKIVLLSHTNLAH